ncbi:MAG: LacI family DNA-binding transcriptional regulator [Rhizorhabdus sp.]
MRVSKAKSRKFSRHLGKPTMADVAKAAGVSLMTVSRVINDPSQVSQKARDAVRQAVSQLDYTPNTAARSLAGMRQTSIGLLLSDVGAGFLNDILLGCMSAASRNNVHVLIENVEESQDPSFLVRSLADANVDGIILAPPLSEDPIIIDLLSEIGIKFVALTASNPDPRALSVYIDDFAAAHAMTRHLLSLGHRTIGFIGGKPFLTASVRRLEGYRAALAQANVEFDPKLIASGLYTYQSGLSAAEYLLAVDGQRPTAIFACNDDMAAATVAVAQRLGIEVPLDLSVCGFDDTLLATAIWPQLTTIRQPLRKMTMEAVEMLLEAKRSGKGLPMADRHRLLGYELVRRQSDAPPRAG